MFTFKKADGPLTGTREHVVHETVWLVEKLVILLVGNRVSFPSVERILSEFTKHETCDHFIRSLETSLMKDNIPSLNQSIILSEMKHHLKYDYRWSFKAFTTYDITINDLLNKDSLEDAI
ncbi:hypothetical protein IMZ31_20450 (plasmid) [Pontibacillus sp. ALD_SL1]|uniref:hypothetical protein n=1 Tax=Pontibacillus sp. ALD_SL1 TaxID=2777185 RepID=UPI001A95C646|nr:hypothetical protein [Pontibacillus sp. ALD_SL1]QST02921.1 hypothetical protein IMZ31_20450 [Pontibacillus sp. ALD_SL1]